MTGREKSQNVLLAIVSKEKLVRVLKHLLNPDEFLSPYGIRSLSKVCFVCFRFIWIL